MPLSVFCASLYLTSSYYALNCLRGIFAHPAPWVLSAVDLVLRSSPCAWCQPLPLSANGTCHGGATVSSTAFSLPPHHSPSAAAWGSLLAVHLPDVFMDAPCFILDCGSDNHYSSPTLLSSLTESQSADFGWNPPCIVRSFCVLPSVTSISCCGQLTIPAVYLLAGRAYMLMAWVLLLPLSWLLTNCLTLWGIWLWLTSGFKGSWDPTTNLILTI